MELAALLLFGIGLLFYWSLRKQESSTSKRIKTAREAKEEMEYREELMEECLRRLDVLKKKVNEIDPERGAKIVRTMMHDKTSLDDD